MRHYKLNPEHFRPDFLSSQDALFRCIFEESPDAIFILHTHNFAIIDCNAKAVQLFQGNEKTDFARMESFRLFDSEPAEFSKKTFIDSINRGSDHQQEMAFRSLKGNVFWGKCSLKKIETAKGVVVVFRVRRVVDYMKTAEMLSTMIQRTSRLTGNEFFAVLNELLVKSFGVSMSFVASADEKADKAEIINGWHKRQSMECRPFKLATSPSLHVLRGYTAYYPNNLKEMFPDDYLIRSLAMESFMGTPVFGVSGEVCGLLVLMDDKPMEEIPNSRYMLSIFASRVGAELERRGEKGEVS